MSPDPDPNDNNDTYRYLGVLLAILSSLANGSSFVVLKLGLRDSSSSSSSSSSANNKSKGGYDYLRNPIWLMGMALHVVGEIFNFAAYAFAPAVLVTPLGALSVLTGAVLGAYILGERLTDVGRFGCALCVVGSVLVVANAPPDRDVASVDEILGLAVRPGFLAFCICTAAYCLTVICVVCPRGRGESNPIWYLSICAGAGAVSVMALKAFGIALKLTMAGKNQFVNFSTYLFGFVAAGCILVQMNYFNKALAVFPQSIVTPIYYVTFTTAVLVASFILFQGMDLADMVKTVSLVSGFVATFMGVYLLNFTGDKIEPRETLPAYEPL